MKQIFILFASLLLINSFCMADEYSWTNIGAKLPDTKSTVTISAIDMIGDSVWICSGYGNYLNQTEGEIYFSTDRGNTFTIQKTMYGTHSIKMIDSKRGYCGGVEGQIYRTSNSGETWERWTSLSRPLMSIDFPQNSDTGFCSGFQGIVKLITPTGLVSVPMQGYVSTIYSVSAIDAKHCFVAGEEIIGPITNGTLMIDQSYPGTSGIYAIDMIDTSYGWCVGSPTAAGAWDSSGCMIIKTTDGHNWEEQVNPVKGKSGTLMAVKAISKSEAWICGTSGVVLRTTDGGNNWIRYAEGLTNEMLYGIAVSNNGEVYISGNNRTLLKYSKYSCVDDNNRFKFSLEQNHPNPYTDRTEIKYSIPESGFVEISIFDALGNKAFDIVNEYKPAGFYSEFVSSARLSSGIYYYQMKYQGETITKQLIVLK